MNHALDACAMIAYLRGEPGGTVVDGFLNTPADTCYAHTINLRYEANRIQQALCHVIPGFKARSGDRVSLWVSRIDGSGMYEIGGIDHAGPAPGEVISILKQPASETGGAYW